MKRIFTTAIALLCLGGITKAQTFGGPDAFGYVWRNSADVSGPVYNWVDIDALPGTVTVAGLQDDNIKGPFVMPISFTYYWYQPATFYIGSNGYVGFTPTPVASPFPGIPVSTGIQNYLAAMCSDLTFTDVSGLPVPNASCQYWVSSANDSLIVTWKNVPFWQTGSPGYTGSNTFQAILTTSDSSITYQYQNQTGASAATSNFCTVGIENISGIIGLQYLFGQYPASGTAVKFYYPPTTTLAINDAATTYIGNPQSSGLFLAANSASYQCVAEVKNSGNQALTPFNVYSRVVNTANQIQVRDTLQTSALSPGQTEVITFPDLFTPTIAGTYRHIVVTQLVGDATPSNNQLERELRVVDTTQLNITLSYNNDIGSTNGISWQGGGGGIGYYFAPPFTPCYLNQVAVQITADQNFVGFYIQVYADDGFNGGPGTLLDSVFIDPANVVAGATTAYNLSQAVLISSGGFYVAWMMGGNGIVLAEDGINPYSKQCYEILGAASNPNSWAEYRNAEVSDPIINAIISNSPVGINTPSVNENLFGSCAPNPAKDYTRIQYQLTENMKNTLCLLYDVQGKLVSKKALGTLASGKGSLFVDTHALQTGVYIVQLTNAEMNFRTKLSVVK
jgi:hypothetical protein